MGREEFEYHLTSTKREGKFPDKCVIGKAGSSLCGDEVEIALEVEDGQVPVARYVSSGCGAARAAASVCTELVEGSTLLEVAMVSVETISSELGGLSMPKMHAAELATDALHSAVSTQLRLGLDKPLSRSGNRTLVAMSGGVDSAVAAILELERGREVVAVTLKLWHDPGTDGSRSCCSPQAVVEARKLAQGMGIPHFTLDLRPEFRDSVVGNYISEHGAGRTPNPCVRCNGTVRFDSMLRLADQLGAERLVTGHYAKVVHDGEGLLVSSASDSQKDQSYMLAALDPGVLEKVEFPLAELTKTEVRQLASKFILPVADSEESQDLCFLAGIDRESFLQRHSSIGASDGEIVDSQGNLLGRHGGYHHYTVGQRKGLGLALAEPHYVLSTDSRSNKVVVGQRHELACKTVELSNAVLYRPASQVNRAKLRYRQQPQPCHLEEDVGRGFHSGLTVSLDEPVFGASPGQVACLMDGSRVVGRGIIS